ncbi:MAG: peptidoglycan-binding protein [Minisyncoccota bacterium]
MFYTAIRNRFFYITLLVILFNYPSFVYAAFNNVQVEVLSYSSARIGVEVSSGGSYVVQYGKDVTYGFQSAPYSPSGSPSHIVFVLSGMAQSSTYHFRICPEGVSSSGSCSSDYTLTTQSNSKDQASLPTLPSMFSTAMPAITGQTLKVSSDCSDLDTKIRLAATLDGNKNHLVEIPAGALCVGPYLFPTKSSGSGVVIVATDKLSNLPPSGSRVSPSDAVYMPKIINNTVTSNQSEALPSSCTDGELYWLTTNSAKNKYYDCINKSWSKVTELPGYSEGDTTPNSCTPGAYFFNTIPGDYRYSLYRCSDIFNRFININPRGDGGFVMAPESNNVSGYRFIGLEFVTMDSYNTPRTFFTIGGNYTTGHSNIVVDRSYFHTHSLPKGGINSAIGLNGSRVALVDSYIDVRTNETNSFPINITSGTGPFKVSNNYVRGAGILLFVNDNDNNVPRSDIEVTRNTFSYNTKFLQGYPGSDGIWRDVRGLIEFKRGTRILIEGNIFDTYWSTLSGGNAIIITPRASGSNNFDNNSYQISDLTIRNNIFRNGSGGILLAGQDDVGYRNTKLTSRVLIDNNLFYNIDSYKWADSSYGATRGQMLAVSNGAEDLVIRHNTFYNPKGTAPSFLHFAYAPIAGLDVRDNVFWVSSDGFGDLGIRWSEPVKMPNGKAGYGKNGSEVLNAVGLQVPDSKYIFSNNVIASSISGWTALNKNLFPANNLWAGDLSTGLSAVSFNNESGGDFGLTGSSQFKNKATDGSDPGVSMVRINSAIAGGFISTPEELAFIPQQTDTTPPVISTISSSENNQIVTITWNTDELSDTQVEFGITNQYGSISVLQNSQTLTHSVTLSSLTPNSVYNYRVISKDSAGNISTSVNKTFTTASVASPSSTPLISLQGLCPTLSTDSFTACFYNGIDFNTFVSASQVSSIAYDWGTDSPAAGVNIDQFSATFDGNFNLAAGDYLFTVTSDDGVRLFIDNVVVIDKWQVQAPTAYTATKTLSAGIHRIKVEYYENYSGAMLNLKWVKTGLSIPPVTPVPVITLSANPTTGVSPVSTTLYWSTTNTPTSCTAGGGWSGSKNSTGGSQSVSGITTATTYTLVCTNAGGTSNIASVNVSVTNTPIQTPSSAPNNQSSTPSAPSSYYAPPSQSSPSTPVSNSSQTTPPVQSATVTNTPIYTIPSLERLYVTKTLSRGISSPEVRSVQEYFKKIGLFDSSVETTTFFGPYTEASTKKYQQSKGIEATGIIGPLTRASLQEGTISTSVSSVVTPTPALINQTSVSKLPTTVSIGMKNDDVVRLQNILKQLGFFSKDVPSTGYFGPLTRQAVQSFQKEYGIVSSGTENTTGYGMSGKKTWTKLLSL